MDVEGWRRSPNGEYIDIDLSGVRARNLDLSGAKLMEAYLAGARLSGEITGLVVNNVEVAPLIEAELNRRDPQRALMAPTDLDGVRAARQIVRGRWDELRARAEHLPEELLQERVDDEWSFVETVRHLVFVADSWIGGVILGRSERHPWGVAPSFVGDPAGLGLDLEARPSFAEVRPVRGERLSMVDEAISGLGPTDLDRARGEHTVLSALRTYFSEEWQHVSYASRDLDVLVARR